MTATKTRKRDAQGRFLPNSAKKPVRKPAKKRKKYNRKPGRKRNALGRFLPNDAQQTKKVTHIALLLDSSASMRGHAKKTQEAYDQIVTTIRNQANDRNNDQDIRVSFYTFGYGVVRKFFEQTSDNLEDIYYSPNEGRTALFEAIHKSIQDLNMLSDSHNVNHSFLIQVITDGQENKNNISSSFLKNAIANCQGTDRWTFAISCPHGYAHHISNRLGLPAGNISEWDPADYEAMGFVGHTHSVGLDRYLSSRTQHNTSSTRKFFADINVGRQNISEVKRNLIPESTQRFKRLRVDKARTIKDFIESKGLVFEKGRVFYMLQKPETVQSYKEIVLQERNNPRIFYTGRQVRDKLGIPHGQDGKIKPGNLGEWVVWVQSTSTNRKLLAKMEVLYDKSPSSSRLIKA